MGQPQPVPDISPGEDSAKPAPVLRLEPTIALKCAAAVAVLAACYYSVFQELYVTWVAPDSYYLHGFLIPPISLFFAWRKRQELSAAPVSPSWWGHVLVAMACLMLVLGDLLGLRVAGQLSFIVMLCGWILALFGPRHLKLLWFPLAFLLMMVPVPTSIIQSIQLHIKLFAAESAVRLARLAYLPVIREGSYVYFGDDHFVIGDVCGGLRSLISLLAVGAVVAYISGARTWARIVLFIASGPIAVLANIVRIFLLCVVGYYYGSVTATGKFHDISGLVIFLVAFFLLFSLDSLLRKIAPNKEDAR